MNSSFFSCNFTHALSAVLSNSIKAKAKKSKRNGAFFLPFSPIAEIKKRKEEFPHSIPVGTVPGTNAQVGHGPVCVYVKQPRPP